MKKKYFFVINLYKSLPLIILFLLLIQKVTFSQYEKIQSDKYAITEFYTPVFSIPDLYSIFGGEDGSTLRLNSVGVAYGLELIAYPNSVFQILESYKIQNSIIFKVRTDKSPYKNARYYIDSRFVKTTNEKPEDVKQDSLTKEIIIERLKSRIGTPYLYGGIFAFGIPQMFEFYSPKDIISDSIKQRWTLTGVDCSGLLYDVTERFTPRSSRELLEFGDSVEIEGKELDDIIELLQPLDIIGYAGHTFYVLDDKYIIEVSPQKGVHTVEIEKRLKWLLAERIPVNNKNSCPENKKCFVVRRWWK